MKEFADDDFRYDENGRKLSKQVENTVGKGEIARYEQVLLFPQCFQKACFPGASKDVIVWEWVKQRVFLSKWKEAIVRPLLKKAGLELQFSSYRPVSNLSFLSKLIEKAVLYRRNIHGNENNLLPKNQLAYIHFHSCESALLRLINDLLHGMEIQEVTVLI